MYNCRLVLSSILLYISVAKGAKMHHVTFAPAGTSMFHFIRSPHRSAFAIATPHLRQMFIARYSAPAATRLKPAAAVAEVTEQQDDVYESAGSQRTYQQQGQQQIPSTLGLGQYANAIPQPAFAEDIRRPAISAIQKALLLQQQTNALRQQSLQYMQQQTLQQMQQSQPLQEYYQPQQQSVAQYYQPQQVISSSPALPQQQYYQVQADQYYQQPSEQYQQYYQPQTDAYDPQLQQLLQQKYQQQQSLQRTGPIQFQQPAPAASETNYSLSESAANSEQQNNKQLLGVAYSPATDVSSFKYASQGLNYNF